MAESEKVITGLSAMVRTESGRKVLRRGDSLPGDALSGEAERLEVLGVYGVPKTPVEDRRDEAEILADEFARSNGDESVVNVAPEVDEIGNVAYMKTANIDEVLKRVGDDAVLARELIAAEKDARGDEARSTLIEKLEEVATEAPEATAPVATGTVEPGGTAPPATVEPVDYSGWKAPQLKEELGKRGIAYPSGVVANTKLVELLEANPAPPATVEPAA